MIWGHMLMMNSTAAWWTLHHLNPRARLRTSLYGLLTWESPKSPVRCSFFISTAVSLHQSLFADWWKHKTQNSWILPALIKSCSKINPEDWDWTPATTNIGEAQHHWSNLNTALKTSLLEAVLLWVNVILLHIPWPIVVVVGLENAMNKRLRK